MPQPLRIASFNVENLFRRARAINLEDVAGNSRVLGQVADLQTALGAPAYDETRIMNLYAQVKAYVEVVETRDKLFRYRGRAPVGLAAAGPQDWGGFLRHRWAKFSDTTRRNTAQVITTIKPDLLCLVEVEDRPTLKAFNTDLLGSRYRYHMVVDGNDRRGIDLGVLSHLPLREIRTHVFDRKPNHQPVFPRDCLELSLELPDGRPIHLLCNHFTSKFNTGAESDPKRQLQAENVKEILNERYDLTSDLVVVAGDLNDTPDARSPLRPLLDVPDLYDVLKETLPEAERWTHSYQGRHQIDYLLVSRPLKKGLDAAGVERRGMYGLEGLTGGQQKSFDQVTHPTNAASDHGMVWADFIV